MTDHLPNPYIPGDKLNPDLPKRTASTVIKLWNGGEHTNAKALAATLKLKADDIAAITEACPGWND